MVAAHLERFPELFIGCGGFYYWPYQWKENASFAFIFHKYIKYSFAAECSAVRCSLQRALVTTSFAFWDAYGRFSALESNSRKTFYLWGFS